MPGQLFNGQSVPLLVSATRTTSSNSGNLKNTTAAFPISDAAAIILDVTALSGSGNTLQVTIDTSPDGGTTWYVAYAFTTISSSTKTARLDIRSTGIGQTEVGAEATTLAAGTAAKANTVLTQDIRISWIHTGTISPSTAFAVWGIFQPLGSKW